MIIPVRYDVKVIGRVELKDKERSVLRLHTKLSMIQSLPRDALDLEKELGFAKLRMELKKEKEEKQDEDAGL